MATTPVQFVCPAGLTLTLEVYLYGSDTIGNTGGDAATEKTNCKGLYSADVTEALAGWFNARIKDGSGATVAQFHVYLRDTTAIHRCEEAPAKMYDGEDVPQVAVATGGIGSGAYDVVALAEVTLAIWDAPTAGLTASASVGKRLVDNITGDAFARLGAPAGASHAADVAVVKSVLPAALVSGRMDSNMQAAAAGVITAAVIADGAIDAATFAAGAINAAAIAADAITDAKVAGDVTIASVTGAVGSVTGAVGSVAGNVGGNVVGSVASVTADVGITQAAADKVWNTAARTLTAFSFAVSISAGAVQAIWDALTSALTTAGSIGKLLTDNINATISSRATPAQVNSECDTALSDYDGPTNAEMVARTLAAADYGTAANQVTITGLIDTELAEVLADTNELQTDWVNGGRLDLLVDAIKAKADGLPADPADASDISASFSSIASTLATIAAFIDTEVAAIKAKTDNLPSDPADESSIQGTLTTLAASLSTIAAFIDTEVAAIKAKTDLIPGSPAAVGSAMTLSAAALDAILIEAGITAGPGLTNDTGTQLTSINVRQALAAILSACAAVLAGAATTNVTFKQAAKPAGNNRIDATVDENGNRTAVALKVPD